MRRATHSWSVPQLLERLRETDEDERIEAKRGLGKATRETVSAFATEPDLGGGWVLFGVVREPDGSYQVTGVAQPDRLQADLANQCASVFNRVLRPEIRVAQVEGACLVAAFMPELPHADKPVYVKATGLPKGAFRRIGSTDQRCNDRDLDMFASRAQRVPFDRRPVHDAGPDPFDPFAIHTFRRQLLASRPGSALHNFGDDDLLVALGAASRVDGQLVPTCAGLLLLGSKNALRRNFPAMRVDYIRVRGAEWTGERGDSYEFSEVREALVTGWRGIFAAVLEDLPKGFSLPEGQLQRRDVPRIPEKVIREALVNALVHRDYELHGSVQVRRFSNRLEIENPGYSLVDEQEWGKPVSRTRNPTLADAFRELGLAETKGTGIRRMREQMRTHCLPMPILESRRPTEAFCLTLLFHHFLDADDLRWLRRLGELDEVDLQLLVHTREQGRITNRELRALSADDTLAASRRLQRLRDRGLLVQHGEAKQSTWYALSEAAQAAHEALVEGVSARRASEPGNLELEPSNLGPEPSNLELEPSNLELEPSNLEPEPSNLGPEPSNLELTQTPRLPATADPPLPPGLAFRVAALPQRAAAREVESLIVALCAERFWEPAALGRLLGRNPTYLKNRFLRRMQAQGQLVLRYPAKKHHPRQAYACPDLAASDVP